MIELARELYAKTLDSYKLHTPEHCKLDVIWNNNLNRSNQIFDSHISAEEAFVNMSMTNYISVDHAYGEFNNIYVRELAVDWLLHYAKDYFDYSDIHQESNFIHPLNIVIRKGRRLGANYLRCWRISTEIAKYNKIPPKRIIELGAGSGHLARSNMLFFPNVQYVIVDIPSTLRYSYMYLKLCFPNKKIFWATKPEEVNTNTFEENDIVFIPSAFTEELASLDLYYDWFVNTASMGEMLNDVIKYWLNYIQNKIKVKYQYTLNRYLNIMQNNGSENWRLNESLCSLLYDDKWKVIEWELEPIWTRCPYIDPQHNRYLRLIAERPWEVNQDVKQNISDINTLEVMQQDRFRKGQYITPDDLLQNDCSMTGALYKLWEAIRLSSSKEKLILMIELLHRMQPKPGYIFEELPAYIDMYKNL